MSHEIDQSPAVLLKAFDIAAIPRLAKGPHQNISQGCCFMEAVAFVSREPWSDHPECVCPVIGAFLRAWNDGLPDDERDSLLRPLIPLVIGTRSTLDVKGRRSLMAADWIVREHTPAWLRLAGCDTQADALAGLPEITDMAQCPSLTVKLRMGRMDKYVDWEEAWTLAGATAHDAAQDAAQVAAWDEAWDEARAVAWTAIQGALRVTSVATLKSTKLTLQLSALALVGRMIAAT